MMSSSKLKLQNIHVLIADGDLYMSGILAHTLHGMGFVNVTRVGNGSRALEVIEERGADILITEWNLQNLDGINLSLRLRDPKQSPDIMLPIIMVTGKAELQNVEQARDSGITEFLVKPFSSVMLFDRIRRVFDEPRDFVLASNYVGPDRRRKQPPENRKNEQRTARPHIVSHVKAGIATDARPILISKSFELQRKANITDSLSRFITADTLEKAQQIIQSYEAESESWIGSDLAKLERSIKRLIENLPGAKLQAENSALAIKSRAGMFQQDLLSNVAFSLYTFLFHDFIAGQPAHLVIIEKHLEVMKVLLASRELGYDRKMEEELASELLKMTAKLKDLRRPPEKLNGPKLESL